MKQLGPKEQAAIARLKEAKGSVEFHHEELSYVIRAGYFRLFSRGLATYTVNPNTLFAKVAFREGWEKTLADQLKEEAKPKKEKVSKKKEADRAKRIAADAAKTKGKKAPAPSKPLPLAEKEASKPSRSPRVVEGMGGMKTGKQASGGVIIAKIAPDAKNGW